MPRNPQVEATFVAAWRAHVVPVVAALGFADVAKVGQPRMRFAARAKRKLATRHAVTLSCTCEAERGRTVSVDVSLRLGALTHDVKTSVAGLRDDAIELRAIASEANPAESLARFAVAIEMVGCALVLAAPAIAQQVPELAADVARASASADWAQRAARFRELWVARHRRSALDETFIEAKLVFAGEKMVSVDVSGARHTFTIVGHTIDAATSLACGGWYTNMVGQVVASRLRAGTRTYHFGVDGRVETIENG